MAKMIIEGKAIEVSAAEKENRGRAESRSQLNAEASQIAQNDLLPMEYMADIVQQLPEQLSGRWGKNRLDHEPQIAANNDLDAVQSWLLEYQESDETFRSYRREAERLLLWCWHQQGRALSDLNRQDIADYQNFLKKPEPESVWCGPRAARNSENWKPFQKGLGIASQKQTLTILKGLFNYLRDADYLRGNPLALIKNKGTGKETKQAGKKIERYLEQEDIDLLLDQLPIDFDSLRSHKEWMRQHTLLNFLYYLAPRASEVADCKMNDFFQRRGRWWWRVMGKGKKYAEVPVPDPLIKQIVKYRKHLELSDFPQPDEDTPFIRSINGNKGISANMVYRLSKKMLT
jgi:site-specific recombinase XerD